MITVILAAYVAILLILIKFKLIRPTLFWKLSPVFVLLFLFFGLFIPLTWVAPQGTAVVVRNSVAIVPSVAGEVIEVVAVPNRPLKQGDVLFRIDPTPYEAQVKAIEAQLGFSRLRLDQMTSLQDSGTGRRFDVEQRQAEVAQLEAQLQSARWNLDKTVVRAPADGYVTNVALRKGARVASLPLAPVMAFIDTSETIVAMSVHQIGIRYVEPGQLVWVTFKTFPGMMKTGKVETVLPALATGQIQTSGLAAAPRGAPPLPFVVRVELDDEAFARQLHTGAVGDAAIFTDRMTFAHLIRRVILWKDAFVNYVDPR